MELGNLYKGGNVLVHTTKSYRVGTNGGQRSNVDPVRSSYGNENRYLLNRKLCGPEIRFVVQERKKETR
jgi:hypothetical protein